MEEQFTTPINQNHTISLKDRNTLDMTGVKTIQSFDSQEFLISSPYGTIHIKGKNLTIAKMDTDNGILQIKGQIDQINYIGDKKSENQVVKEKKENIFTKIFK